MMKRIYETLHINDECYTPDYAVRPLLKYLEKFKGKTIWCPFDTEESEYVKILTQAGFNVIYSHKDDGQNFYDFGDGLFATDMPDFDLIVSNPPFHNKALLVEKIIAMGKPFALLLPLTWLNDSAPFRLFSRGGTYNSCFLIKGSNSKIAAINPVLGVGITAGEFCHVTLFLNH